MLKKINLKDFLPHLIAIIVFILISFAYFPEVFEGKQLGGHDNANFKGMARELIDYREETGDEAFWTNNMFGGMPTFMSGLGYKGNMLKYLNNFLQVGPRPVSFLFLYLIGFYVLLIVLRVNPWLAIAGSIAFAFSSYNFVVVAAGHNSKAIAIAYMAPVLAGILLTFRGKWLLGAALTAIALSMQISVNHPQITYYTLIMVLILGISELIFAIREKQIQKLLLATGILFLAAGIGAASNTDRLWSALNYGKYTMRSESELTKDGEDKTSGLTKSYATQWSYGIDETLSLLIPGFKGGASDAPLSDRSATYKLFAASNPQQAREVIHHLPLYWGKQVSTVGNIYIGAIIVFLFVLGMFLLEHRTKWWLFAATLLGIFLAWGQNFMWLTDLFMDYFPGYNKFRTVSMTLVIPALAMPILGILTLNEILTGKIPRKKLYDALKWSVGLTGGIALIFAMFPDLAGDFVSARDASYQPQLAEALQEDRRSLLRTDALRSLIFILLTTCTILLVEHKKIKSHIAIVLVGVLFLLDMWPVNKRYLNEEDFSPKREAAAPFKATPADQFILQQKGDNQRVLNLTVSVFQDASTSYFHPSIGGYHGAKLRRYQDVMETGLQDDMDILFRSLQSQDYNVVDSALAQTKFLNLFNTRYIIINPNTSPIINRHAAGNAWFVQKVEVVEDADTEIATIPDIDIQSTCTMDQRYAGMLNNLSFEADSASQIRLGAYSPNRMEYHCKTAREQMAVFSEVYYPEGWTATIDGEKVPHFRVDYLMRGMVVPEGEHEIVFEFKPRTYIVGTKISKVSSILLILIALGSLGLEFRRKN